MLPWWELHGFTLLVLPLLELLGPSVGCWWLGWLYFPVVWRPLDISFFNSWDYIWCLVAFSSCLNRHILLWVCPSWSCRNCCTERKYKRGAKCRWPLKPVSELQSTCLLVITNDTSEMTIPQNRLAITKKKRKSLFLKFTAWKQHIGFYMHFLVWGGARFFQASVRLKRGLQRGHQAVGRITVILLQLVGLSCWSTGVTLRLVDLFQKPLNSKNKFRGDYSTLYHLHNLSISNTSHIVKCVCLYICLLKGLGSKDKLWQWCGLYLTLSKGKYLLFGCTAFRKRKTKCLHEPFLLPLHRLCRTYKKKEQVWL